MLNNYVLVALRHLIRHKGYTAINVVGLALGLACFVLMLRYVQYEQSYDRQHSQADRIYRIAEVAGDAEEAASVPLPVGATVRTDFPHLVEHAVRFYDMQAPALVLHYEPPTGTPVRFYESRFFFADSTVFSVFDFPFVQGDPATALDAPQALVLTEAMAEKYFGDADPLGQTLRFEGTLDLEVTGVVADLPENLHFQFDFLASWSTLPTVYADNPSLLEGWAWNPAWTYVLLQEQATPATLEAQFPAFVQKYFHPVIRDKVSLYLQPLTDIHLHSNLDFEIAPNSDVTYVYLFQAVAVLILLIAGINFLNLATARSVRRAREVGLRKVLGARRSQILRQFLGEALLTAGLGFVLALPLAYALLPLVNGIAGTALTLDLLAHPSLLLLLFGAVTVLGLLSGLYPALFLSGFQPAVVLKGPLRLRRQAAPTLLRRGLVTAQFIITLVLIVSTLQIYQQVDFLRSARLGIKAEQVIMAPVPQEGFGEVYPSLREAWLSHAHVTATTLTQDILGRKHDTCAVRPEGFDEALQVKCMWVPGDDFAKTFGLSLEAGSDLEEEHTGSGSAVLVNQAFVEAYGWEEPGKAIGQPFLNAQGNPWTKVIGVVSDFHFASLRQAVEPFVAVHTGDGWTAQALFSRYVALRVEGGHVPDVLTHLQAQWQARLPDTPFAYFFLQDNLADLYRNEETLGRVAGTFSGLAIFLACLGLLGLTAFLTEERTKELGIRKVLGATVSGLLALLTRDFLKLLLAAFFLATPLAYFGLRWWLRSFAYDAGIAWWAFLLAGVFTLSIALLTVSYQTFRAATADPVRSLRYE